MLIKTITVENFLPFQGKQKVEFSTDPDRNVTLIMGDNGAGKTSLAQAFEWCLYGRSPKESPQVINAYVRDRISPSAYVYSSVEIEMEKDGVDYSILRKQRYSRKESGVLDRPGQQEFGITYKENGETKQISASDQKATINKLLSSELSHYFFFDGEHVKNMRSEIESGKSSDFADAVKTILGLQPIAAALDHLKAPGTRNSVERTFKKQFDVAGNQDLEAKSQRIQVLESRIERLKGEKEDAEADERAAKDNVAKYNELLAENAESEQAAKAVERAKRLLGQAKSVQKAKLDAIFKLFRGDQYRLFSMRPISDARKELADEDKISKGVPSVNDKTIKFLLERKQCICGTKFDTGDEIMQHLVDLLAYVPPKDLGTYISEFDKECRLRTEGEFSLPADIATAYREFAEAEKAVLNAEQALKSAQDYLNGINQVDVSILRKNLQKAEEDQRRAAGRAYKASSDISGANSEINKLQSEIEAYSVKSAKNKEVKTCLAYVDFIYDYLSSFYGKKEAETRDDLESVVNKFFSTMYNGELHLELDGNYGVTVVVDDIDTTNDVWKTSSGQTLAIILAFILGILDIAKRNIRKGDELLHGDTYPLVMDAPLSDFDKTRIGTICSLLPSVAEQVVIIIKDTDGDLAEQHLASQIGRRYTIARIKDYESVIKE